MTKIEWTEETWNPVVGCSVVSPGCTNCYAMKMAGRLEAMGMAHYRSTTAGSRAGAVWTGKVALAPESVLLKPLRWKKPRAIFVNSMGDLFHEAVPDEWIDRVFAVMALAPQHTFQVLTKRAERMRAYMTRRDVPGMVGHVDVEVRVDRAVVAMVGEERAWRTVLGGCDGWPLPNVWLGVSAEDQARADARIPLLLDTPAAVRFVSAEPLLGPIDLKHLRQYTGYPVIHALRGLVTRGCLPRSPDECGFNTSTRIPGELPRLDWVIVGGESGPGARRMEEAWAESLLEQCRAAGVAFFMKQMARKAPIPAHLLVREMPHAAR